jgi:hypothetical protein
MGLLLAWRSPWPVLAAQPHVDRCVAQRPLAFGLFRKAVAPKRKLCPLNNGEGERGGARLPRMDRGRPSSLERKDGTEVKIGFRNPTSLPGFDSPTLPSEKTVPRG